MKEEELKIRLDERLRIYKDSSAVVATYADLAHFAEDIISMLDNKQIGFNNNEEKE